MVTAHEVEGDTIPEGDEEGAENEEEGGQEAEETEAKSPLPQV